MQETSNKQTEFLRDEFHGQMQASTQKTDAEIHGMVNSFEPEFNML